MSYKHLALSFHASVRSVRVFEQIVTVSCSMIILFLFLIHKVSALQKMVCNADTLSHIKQLADRLHLGTISHIVKMQNSQA